jgi:hypothetical protein
MTLRGKGLANHEMSIMLGNICAELPHLREIDAEVLLGLATSLQILVDSSLSSFLVKKGQHV